MEGWANTFMRLVLNVWARLVGKCNDLGGITNQHKTELLSLMDLAYKNILDKILRRHVLPLPTLSPDMLPNEHNSDLLDSCMIIPRRRRQPQTLDEL